MRLHLNIQLTVFFLFVSLLVTNCHSGNKNRSNETRPGRAEYSEAPDTVDGRSGQGQKADTPASLDILIEQYEDSDRGTWQNPELVLAKPGELEGKIVADIGSGTGYFTFRIARRAAKVIALDIEKRFLDYIEDRKLELPPSIASKIETRHTPEDAPSLQPGEVDVIFMVNVYYYLDQRIEYMNKVNTALQRDGLLIVVDFKPGEMAVGPLDDKVPMSKVMADLRAAGFSIVEADNTSLQYQYIVSAKPNV